MTYHTGLKYLFRFDKMGPIQKIFAICLIVYGKN